VVVALMHKVMLIVSTAVPKTSLGAKPTPPPPFTPCPLQV
jgi:hypothetical protein